MSNMSLVTPDHVTQSPLQSACLNLAGDGARVGN